MRLRKRWADVDRRTYVFVIARRLLPTRQSSRLIAEVDCFAHRLALTTMKIPILYSYRRCPYAMRARMALKLAGIEVEIREISLREKPAHMLQVSPKGTVPVLILPDGSVIEESIEIMLFALKADALGATLYQTNGHAGAAALILQNDTDFKQVLDAYKHPERCSTQSQLESRQQGEVFLQQLENLLSKNTYLFDIRPSLADIAIFPFIRQFAAVDSGWFEISPYPNLRIWLKNWTNTDLFKSVMTKNPTFVG